MEKENLREKQLVHRFLLKKIDGASDWDQHWSSFVVPISDQFYEKSLFLSGAKVARKRFSRILRRSRKSAFSNCFVKRFLGSRPIIKITIQSRFSSVQS